MEQVESTTLVTGGAGFIGSHVAEYYAKKRFHVIIFDNLSRAHIFRQGYEYMKYNWHYLKKFENIKLINGDITNFEQLKEVCRDVDIIIHTAAQTAVTTSMKDPRTDFLINALGTFNMLEVARKYCNNPLFIYCSTNKVYGSNINRISVLEKKTRYVFKDEFEKGIPESFPIDLCEHTPYGCSKLVGDIYSQDYGKIYGLKTVVFRMSCIYGPRQFGVEDQGWVAWFSIATIIGKPLTIYGDGKQVRDILYIDDLIDAFDRCVQKQNLSPGEVFNIGGGPKNTISLLELLDLLEQLTGKRTKISFTRWRPSDQKVYISDVSKAKRELRWVPKTNPVEGIKSIVRWILEHKKLFK
jgi:CDP-paratose 2-epimerase